MELRWSAMIARRKRIVAALLLALLGIASCTNPTEPPTVVNVSLDDEALVVEEGSTLALHFSVVTVGGALEALTWSSDAPETATVSSTGVVTGISVGEARVTATSALDASKMDSVTITVTPPPVAPGVLDVSIDPGERSMLVSETLPLSASVDSVGGASEAVTWASDDTATATVNAAGVVTGVTVGDALITATSVVDASKSASSLISVVTVPPGAPARLSVVTGDGQTAVAGSSVPIPPTVRVRDGDENPLSGVGVTFTVTAGNGTVAPTAPVTTNADGIAGLSSWTLGNDAGVNGVRASVTGSSPPIRATFSATGVAGPASPETSTITANPTSLPANGAATSRLTIQLKDAFGNDLTSGGAAVSFATPSQGSIGAVIDNGNGTYSATYTADTAVGSVEITPRLSGVRFSDTTTITLTAALSVTIDQTSPTVRVGDTLLLTASVDAVGDASTAVTWSSSDPDVATIHATTGEVIGNAGGITTIRATSTHDASASGTVTLSVPPPMILTVETNPWNTDTRIRLGLGGAVDVNIDWGDATWTRATTAGNQTHTYAASGTYTIRIAGDLDQLGHAWSSHSRITGVTAWGDLGLTSLSGAFSGAKIRTLPATLPPTVTDTSYMFESASLAGDISTWDVSNVTDMSGMFSSPEGGYGLDPDIGNWDVSNVTNMSGMFHGNYGFHRDIGGWNVSSVTTMRLMFYNSFFDRDLGAWDVSQVTSMSKMFGADGYFQENPFNSDIGDWDVSNVTNMDGMFKDNRAFNRDIGDWDVSNVTTMRLMFGSEDLIDGAFDQDIGRWDVSNVTDMYRMFAWSPFDQDIGGWNVSNVTNMEGMFADNRAFNRDIGDWDVSNVTTMRLMFGSEESNSGAFNQDIGRWDVSNVVKMAEMFNGASAFNQNLADWCVVNIPVEPDRFAHGADAWVLPKPVWGTCPAG